MKNILKTLALVLALAVCMAVPTFAVTIDEDPFTASTDVNGIYKVGSSADERISVDVVWGSMSFTYNDTVEGTWNEDTHGYDNAEAAKWTYETGANKITVTNHSNTAVEAQFSFAAVENSGIKGTFTAATMDIDTAEGTEYDDAPFVENYFTITEGAITENGKLGTITVKIVNA